MKTMIKAFIIGLFLVLSSMNHVNAIGVAPGICVVNPNAGLCEGFVRPRPPAVPCPGVPNCWLDPWGEVVRYE